MQINFIDTKLDRKVRRKVERMLSAYGSIEAIIDSLEMELPGTKMTVNYEVSESQRGNQFHSETEKVALAKSKIDEYKKTKAKLDRLYDSMKPIQRDIWHERYIIGKFDEQVYFDLQVSERHYYRMKREMLAVIAEAFCLL